MTTSSEMTTLNMENATGATVAPGGHTDPDAPATIQMIDEAVTSDAKEEYETYVGNRIQNTGRMASSAAIVTYEKITADQHTTNHTNMRRKASKAALHADEQVRAGKNFQEAQATVEEIEENLGCEIYEHMFSIPEVCKLYHTSTDNGIDSAARVAEMQAQYGKNMLTPPAITPWFVKLFLHMVGGFSLLLWAGAGLCFLVFVLDGSADNLYLGIVLSAVVFLTGVFSWYQEMMSDAAMSAFKDMTPDKACVMRTYESPGWHPGFDATELVRGDVVKIEQDQRIPADVMIFSQTDVKVDMAALTGEAIPLVRDIKATNPMPHETKNLCFYGTFCVQGSCHGIVVRTGDETMVGQIAKQTIEGKPPKTTMEREIEIFIHVVSGVAAVIGITFFIVAIVTGYSFLEAVIFMIGIIVANVPEGLLATVTVALTLTAKNMADKHVMVKDAKTIETLGSITCIASDKTGTLTQNIMTATHAIYSNKIVTLDPTLTDDKGRYDTSDQVFSQLRRISCLCGKAEFVETTKEGTEDDIKTVEHYNPKTQQWLKNLKDRKATGDASETALLKFNEPIMEEWYKSAPAASVQPPQYVKEYRSRHSILGSVPFNSTNKWMCTMHKASADDSAFQHTVSDGAQITNDDDIVVMVKGAPERIMSMANYIMVDPAVQEDDQKAKANPARPDLVPWDETEKSRVYKLQVELASMGERVLGFGMCVLPRGMEHLLGNGCKRNASTGVFEIDAAQMTSMPTGEEGDYPNGGFLWAPAGTKWDAPEGASGDEDAPKSWVVPEVFTGMIFVGMMSLVDPPREEVGEAIQNCHTAGINVVMVTGDHPVTAKAISERIGILEANSTIEDWVQDQLKEGEKGVRILKKLMWDQEWDEATGKTKPDSGFQMQFDGKDVAWNDVTEEMVVAEVARREGASELQQKEVAKFKAVTEPKGDQLLFGWGKDSPARWELSDAGRGDHKVEMEVEVLDSEGKRSMEKKRVTRQTSYKDPKIGWWRGFKFHQPNGLPHPGDPVKGLVVAGPQLDEFDESDWRYALSRTQLTFARTLPAQKQDIVRHMQSHHESMAYIGVKGIKANVVAVTGDGVNDSPALKTADCGVAMGTGSEVAQEAANMILMNDDFTSIVEGIKQGRLIFDNLKKSIAYTLTSNIPEITPFLALICLQIPIPLETVMILCIDLGTDMLPAISLAYEEPENDIMLRQPRDKNADHLVNDKLIGLTYGMIGMVQAAAGFTCYYAVLASYNLNHEDISGTGFKYISKDEKFVCGLDYDTRMGYLRQAQTSFLMSIIVVQWADVMICKTRMKSIVDQGMKNNVLIIGLIEELLLGFVLSYVPFANTAFKTAPLDFVMWTYGIPFAILILLFDEGRKWLLRREVEAGKAAVAGTDEKPAIGFVENCTYY